MGGLGYLANRYLANNYPRYTATGLVKVDPSVSYNPLDKQASVVDISTLQIEQRTQVQLMKNESLMNAVLSKPDSKIGDGSIFRFSGAMADDRSVTIVSCKVNGLDSFRQRADLIYFYKNGIGRSF